MINVGFVLYKKTEAPGTLNAIWCQRDGGNVTGVATGGSTEGYEGNYLICYFDDKGNIKADRELKIHKDGNFYKLQWLNNGKVTCEGIGMETAEGLSVGYCDL